MKKPYLVILGSAAAMPSPQRFVPSIAIVGSKEIILLDAGEGTQIRLQEAGISLAKIKVIAVTHLHGDHFLGLFPLIQSMALQSQSLSSKILILSPSEDLCSILKNIDIVEQCIVVSHGQTVTTLESVITPVKVDHGPINAFGYHLKIVIGKGGKCVRVFYGGDGICRSECLQIIKNLGVDVVIHDASFSVMDIGKAVISNHATVLDAALLAKELQAKLLVLTHVSSRYVDHRSLLTEAKRIFPHVVMAEDLLSIPLALYASVC